MSTSIKTVNALDLSSYPLGSLEKVIIMQNNKYCYHNNLYDVKIYFIQKVIFDFFTGPSDHK